MKPKTWICLAVALCVSAFAGELTDAANVFGPQAANVRNAVSSLPVWIETRVTPPAEGIKVYADARAGEVSSRGFYVVITSQPREWRVSMNPVGLASSEAVRMAGDRMVARFQRGEFSAGAINLAHELDRLANPPTPAPRQSGVDKAWAELEALKKKAKADAEERIFWTWVCVGIAGCGLFIWWFVWLMRRAARKEEERRQRWSAMTQELKRPLRETVDPTEAKRVFDSYTPAQRETIIRERHDHYYSSGAMTDPLMFYLLMNAATQPHYVPAPSYEAPRHYSSPPSDPEPRREESSSSFSDSSGSSSSASYDSGSPSSSDSSSSSSSDSSGGGGSW